MTAKTVAERQQALVARRRAAGLKEVRNLWAHPEDEAAIRLYAAKLQRRRERVAKSVPHLPSGHS